MTSSSLSPSTPHTPTQPTGRRQSRTTAVGRIRLFVGGLPADVTGEELQARFQPFGKVIGSEIVPQKEDAWTCRGFGYVDLEPVSEASLSKCFAVYNGSKWRGGRLRVEKARASFLDRLKAEWAAQTEVQSEADKPGSETDKRGAEINKPEAEPTKAELLDSKGPKAKPAFEPLRLKWGSWEFEKRTKVVPAAGGTKIKKSFRNVPEKSLWELEGMGGSEALSGAKPPPTKGVAATRTAETRPQGVNGVGLSGEPLKEGSAGTKVNRRSENEKLIEAEERIEILEGSSEDEGMEGTRSEAEGRRGDGVKGRVRELTAWEKLMQKAAAGQEDDDFIDEEVGGLEGFGALGKSPGNTETARGTEGLEQRLPIGGGLEKGQVEEKGKGKQGLNGLARAERANVRKPKPVGLSDWERLMQKAAGALDEEGSLDGVETDEVQQASGEGADGSKEAEGLGRDGSQGVLEVSKADGPGMGIGGLDRDREAAPNEGGTKIWDPDAEIADGGPDDVAAAGEDEPEAATSEEPSGRSETEEEDHVMEDADVIVRVAGEADDDVRGDEVGDGAEGTGEEESGSIDGEGLEEGSESGGGSFGSEDERSGSVTDEGEEMSEGEAREWQGEVPAEEERSSGDGAGESGGEERNSGGAEPDSDDDGTALDEEHDSGEDDAGFGRKQLLPRSASHLPAKISDDAKSDFETAPAQDLNAETAAGVPPESAVADGIAAERTAEEEEIARQLAEERRKQLDILGAMFPDNARFFSEEAVQKAKPASGFAPVARFEPSAAAKGSPGNYADGPEANERATGAAPMESEEWMGTGLTGRGRKTLTRATTAERDPEKSGKEAGETRTGRLGMESAGVKGVKKPRRGGSEGEAVVTERKGGVTTEVENLTRERVHVEGKEARSGAAMESGNGARSGNGTRSGLEMVGEVVSRLSPQVLKYLDSELLQRLTSGSKGSGKEGKRGQGEGETGGKMKRGKAEEGGKTEGKEAKQKERRGIRNSGEAKGRQEASRKTENRAQRPESREEVLGPGGPGETTGKGGHGENRGQKPGKRKHRESPEDHQGNGHHGTEHQPGGDAEVGAKGTGQNEHGRSDEAATGGSPEETTGGLSLEERRRLKREKRAQRRGSEAAGIPDTGTDHLDAGTDRSDGPTAVPVKQEVFVNPNWRTLVGYVGGGKPTFSLASVLGDAPVAGGSGPSDGPKASVDGRNAFLNTASNKNAPGAAYNGRPETDSGVDPALVQGNASGRPTGGRSPLTDATKAGVVLAADSPVRAPRHNDVSTGRGLAAGGPGDEDPGLSFVRSATAEQEWLASKSALSIDYKRKKRIAARVAPGGGKKRG